MTQVPADRQKWMGFPGGMLKDSDDLLAKAAKLKPGAKVMLVGTAEGAELKAPAGLSCMWGFAKCWHSLIRRL